MVGSGGELDPRHYRVFRERLALSPENALCCDFLQRDSILAGAGFQLI